MCSFVFSTIQPTTTEFNRIMALRGPDFTQSHVIEGCFFCHNLLSMRGDYVGQPYVADTENVVVMFNGEIYNCPETYSSEARYLFDLYKDKGADCFKELDGEYAIVIVDFCAGVVHVARDCFGTKPLFFGARGDEFGFASYRDALLVLGFDEVRPLKPNHAVEYSLDRTRILEREIYTFNLAQFKTDMTGWFDAFDRAVAKRVKHMKGKAFVGLSSGYDSGAIAASLIAQGKDFMSVTVEGREDPEVVEGRLAAVRASGNEPITIPDTELEVEKLRKWLDDNVEDQPYVIVNDSGERVEVGKSVHKDKAALILAGVCERAKAAGALVYLSGSGADEIVSDYGFDGHKFFAHSNFGGKFPNNLLGRFPWASVFGSTQAAYLAKEEMVAGSFGMEARYPFLDVEVVQEFLNLKAEVKNRLYKSVIREYLAHRDFPVKENVKIGFGFKPQDKDKKKKPFFRFLSKKKLARLFR
ncbi:asparagine synthase-related protein [Roseibium sediminicola]|uniref:asparagine synthase (glutamine-hydrolyzing) n=1 Tax=Roseibium sediminicola TaxID=2933272 RepID=A0ABT0H0X0_9HYPH|nr:asparagine synthase-related protein [Roseibium sp. CAU 1639]MCK7615335.1 asparagine synthase-related protein [Roseibium sp. CAU 1639]